jgi:uncharacterized membrane protein YhaH (DUF805 family)
MDTKRLLFSFEGRMSRAKYWLATLIILCWMLLVLMVLAALASVFGIGGPPFAIDVGGISASIQLGDDHPAKGALVTQLVLIPMTLIFAWSYAAISIRRLHDRDKSGWWMASYVVAPALYDRFGDLLGSSYVATSIGLAVFIALIWGLVDMCLLKGTHGPNRFGPDPLTPRDTRPRWDQQSELEFIPHRAGPSAGA